jgi:copper chaperone NosL
MENRETARLTASSIVLIVLLCCASTLSVSCGPTRGAVKADSAFGYCPVCEMKVKQTDDWAAEIYYPDGKKLMFESPGDMLSFYTSPKFFHVDDAYKDKSKMDKILVKDYQTKQATDARQAFFVYKSKVGGPMGADFLPFGKREDAQSFISANGGTLLTLDEVTGEMARDLRK